MRYAIGLLFIIWGSSEIFNFNIEIKKYIVPVILIGIGLNLIFSKNKCYHKKNRHFGDEFHDK